MKYTYVTIQWLNVKSDHKTLLNTWEKSEVRVP